MFGPNKNNEVIILDIGSASVAGTRVAIPTNQKKIDFKDSIRHEADFKDRVSFKVFFEEIEKALRNILADLKKKNNHSADKIVCFLSSPFYLSKTKTIVYTESSPFTVDDKLINRLMVQEAEKFLISRKKIYPEITDDKNLLIENKIMAIRLNGYPITSVNNQSAFKLEIDGYLSLSSKAVINRLTEIIIQAGLSKKVTFHSFAFAGFSTLRDIDDDDDDTFVLLDISGELSDLVFSLKGVLLENLSFPLGKNYIIRKIADVFKTIPAEAKSLIKLYSAGQVNAQIEKRVSTALSEIKEEWNKTFRQGLLSLMDVGILPELIYLVGEDNSIRIFEDWLIEDGFKDLTFGHKGIKIVSIKPNMFKPLDHPQIEGLDPFLAIEGLFLKSIL
jgi:cell division ATPase FtsA